jgi:predicted small metal-binding protein
MQKVLRCDCGYEVRTGDDAELVAQVQRHALTVHGMRFSPDDVLRLANRAEHDERTGSEARPITTPTDPKTRTGGTR